MSVRPMAALVALALAAGGCSALLVKGPPASSGGDPDCTTGPLFPAADLGGAAALAYAAAGLQAGQPEDGATFRDSSSLILLGGAVVLAVSGGLGLRKVGACKRWHEQQDLSRALRPFTAPRLRAPGGDPWLAAGAPPEGFSAPPAPAAPPDGGAGDAGAVR